MIKRLILLIACFSICGFGGVLTDAYTKPVYEGLPTNGLVLHYKMDESSWNGTVGEVKDSAGTNNATAYGGAFTNPGKFDRSGVFDGVNDHVDSTTISPSSNYTIAVWIKTSLAGTVIQKVYGVNGKYEYAIRVQDGVIRFIQYDGTTVYSLYSTSVVNDNQWRHITVSFSDVTKTVTIYIDGVYNKEGVNNRDCISGTNGCRVGAFMGGPVRFTGSIDDIRIYNRVLSSNEISQIYLAESYSKRPPVTILQGDQFKPTDISGLALWLDSSDTSTLWDSPVGGSLSVNGGVVGRWEDKSGNSNHATNGVVANMPKRSDNARNGKTGILFDTTDFIGFARTANIGSACTVFFTMNPRVTPGYIAMASGASTGYILQTAPGSVSTVVYSDAGTPTMYIRGILKTSPTRGFLYTEGYQQPIIYSLTAVNFNTWQNIVLNGYSGLHITGDMYDIIIYNRVLSDVERTQVEKYLSSKWAINLNNITNPSSTIDNILKMQTPVGAVYQGTNRVYRFKNRNYPKTVQ